MKLKVFEEKIHSHVLFWICFITIVFLFLSQNRTCNQLVFIVTICIFFYQDFHWNRFFKILGVTLLFAFTSCYFILLNPGKQFNGPPFFEIFGINFSVELFKIQTLVFLRVFMISVVSLMGVYSINFEKIIIELMKFKVISIKLGYPILLAFNSLGQLRAELTRIQINAKFRNIHFFKRINIFIPLLVFAIRHADRGAMSLVTRGMSKDKLFYFYTDLKKRDYLIFSVYLMLIFICGTIQFFL